MLKYELGAKQIALKKRSTQEGTTESLRRVALTGREKKGAPLPYNLGPILSYTTLSYGLCHREFHY